MDSTAPAPRAASEGSNQTAASSTENSRPLDEAIPTRQNNGLQGKPAVNESAPEKKDAEPSRFRTIWGSLGLDAGTVMMMFKGSLPPTIAIAFYQADSVANFFSTLGYLVPIISVLAMCIMPRAKFFQTLVLNTIGICIGSAVSLLGIWTGVQARNHTAPGSVGYNSSQSAVCAIWLFANIYLVNVFRAKVPALQFPAIMYSIFTNVSFTYGPLFPNMAAGESLIKRLLEGFLTAFAIATGVNLFIIPITSRTVVFKEQTGYIMAIRATIKAQTAYLQSLETTNMFGDDEDVVDDTGEVKFDSPPPRSVDASSPKATETAEAKTLKASIAGLTALHGKLHGDMPFGKREIAWGKLNAADIDKIFHGFRSILIPLIGLSTISDIFERIAERRGWVKSDIKRFNKLEHWETVSSPQAKMEEKRVWNEMMKVLHQPFSIVCQAMDEGMEHAGIVLELLPKPKKKAAADIEEKGDSMLPGDETFGDHLDKRMKEFYAGRGETIRAWARSKGLTAQEFDLEGRAVPGSSSEWTEDDCRHRRDQQQLYLILYMEHLLYSAGSAITDFVRYADGKVKDGTMKKNRLILPGFRRIRKWMKEIASEDVNADNSTPDSVQSTSQSVYLGSGFNKHRSDPEHLAPKTIWQHTGNYIRIIPRFFGSTESAFGFRVACATLTIGIVAFLESSQDFFVKQRLVWAMIIIAIGMSMTSGQSTFGFFGRIAGTALSMVFSIVIWYIVDQQVPGVIVMLWFFIFMEMYLFIKYPRFIAIWLVCMVTQVLIIGYELQVKKIGIALASASGQPYYPIYELAPYRLACVAGGSFVAFIWTVFPYPISDRSWLRKDLGATMHLLANYYSVVHSSINARMHGTDGDLEDKNSPGHKLAKVRERIFGKLMMLLPSLNQHAEWQKWEINVGGKFPRKHYEEIVIRSRNILNYLTLTSYATQAWSESYPNLPPNARRSWLHDFTGLIDEISPTSHQITSILSMLSASVSQGTPLPPHIKSMLPMPYMLSKRLEDMDRGILDAKHVEELGYSSYAVMQVATALIVDDLERLVVEVKELVGEVDFSFSVGGSSSDVSEVGKGKRD